MATRYTTHAEEGPCSSLGSRTLPERLIDLSEISISVNQAVPLRRNRKLPAALDIVFQL